MNALLIGKGEGMSMLSESPCMKRTVKKNQLFIVFFIVLFTCSETMKFDHRIFIGYAYVIL